jgi:hypothetical protein
LTADAPTGTLLPMPEQGPRKAVRILILLVAVVLLIAAGVIAVVVHFSGENVIPTKLVLPDGRTVFVAGADYGTNHVSGSRFMRWAARTPPVVLAGLRKLFGPRVVPKRTFVTATPMLVVWLDSPTAGGIPPPVPGWYEVYLADTNGFVSGASQTIWPGMGITALMQFSAFPRRARFFGLHVFYHDAQNKVSDCGTLNIVNPEYRSYPRWKPEALPVTRRAGDVEATLEQFRTGQGSDMSHTAMDGGGGVVEFKRGTWNAGNETAFRLQLRSLAGTNQVWRVDHVEVSDATGNMLQSMGMSWGTPGEDVYGFNPGLWTNEAAWKLRCEIKRTAGFGTNELLTFEKVPLPEMSKTNYVGWSTNLNGVTVTFDYIVRRPPYTNGAWSGNQLSEAHFLMKGLSNDFHLDLLETRTDTGTNVQSGSSSWSNDGQWQEHGLDIPADAKSLDFTFAVHQGRWVEFMVKPETGPARFEFPEPQRKKAD